MKIKQLYIYTQNLKAQKEFYGEVLGLPVKQIESNKIQLSLGFSELILEEKPTAKPYHIAFHIPAEKIDEAKKWLQSKVELLSFENKPIIDFPAWKAKSLYFYDKNLNILEFISREDLFPKTEEPFDAEQILGIAEIGLVTDNVQEKFNFLQQEFQLEKYGGNLQEFCPTGNDMGLFIIIAHRLKDWFPTNDRAYSVDFQITFLHQKKNFAFRFQNNKLNKI